MTANYEEIRYDVEDGVATITINRPDQLNALTDLTQAEIRHALGTVREQSRSYWYRANRRRSRILLRRRHERPRRHERSRQAARQ